MSSSSRNSVVAPPDELVPSPFGLEMKAARALIRSGELPARKIGRRFYARRSDVLALIDGALDRLGIPHVRIGRRTVCKVSDWLAAIDARTGSAANDVAWDEDAVVKAAARGKR